MPPRKLLTAAVIAGLVAVPAVDAKAPPPQKKGATYSGVTSQGKSACSSGGSTQQPCTVTVQVSKDGKKVKKLRLLFTAACDDNNVYQDSTAVVHQKIINGKYAADGAYNETLGDGTKLKNTVLTHGKFKHKGKKYTLVGDFRLVADVTYTNGSTTRCASGKVTFAIKAQ
jgi:uncharacterized membrane protein